MFSDSIYFCCLTKTLKPSTGFYFGSKSKFKNSEVFTDKVLDSLQTQNKNLKNNKIFSFFLNLFKKKSESRRVIL